MDKVQDWLDEKTIGWIAGMLLAAGAVMYKIWTLVTSIGRTKSMFSNGDMECLRQLTQEVHQWRESMSSQTDMWRSEMAEYRRASEEQNRVVHGNSRAMNDLRAEISQFRVELGEMKGRLHDI